MFDVVLQNICCIRNLTEQFQRKIYSIKTKITQRCPSIYDSM